MEITTVGLDLAKNVFQVHAIGSTGEVIIRRSLKRAQVIPFFSKLPPCLIGMEACGTSHHWARELVDLGHEVRLMPPAYVKPYVKRGKTDAGDAEAICEAVTRPTMRFVPIKSVEQQAALALHRTRDLLVRQRTQLINMIRGLLAEFGIDIPKGITNALAFVRRAVAGEANEVPDLATKVIGALAEQAIEVQGRIRQLERDLLAWFRSNELARRIATVPGVGLLGASAIAATVTDPTQFRSGRQFAAWLGLTPLNNSSGGQGTPRSDLQDGPPVPSATAGHRHDVARQTQQASPQLARPSLHRPARPQAAPRGDSRHGQPRGPSHLGHHGTGRGLPDADAWLANGLRTMIDERGIARRGCEDPVK